jgi:hypothetical protein
MAKAAPPNPFATARTAAPASSKPRTNVYNVADVLAPTGGVLYSRDAVSSAIENFCKGKEQYDEGKTLMDMNRPPIEAFGIYGFCGEWLAGGKLPENPKLTTDPNGAGYVIGISFVDKEVNLTDDEYTHIANLIGAPAAEANTVKRDVFTLNGDVLDQEVEVADPNNKGKKVADTVMNHVAAALTEKFKDNPEILANLFTRKPIHRTAKGLIHKGLQLVCQNGLRDPSARFKLGEFIRGTKTVIQLKPGK